MDTQYHEDYYKGFIKKYFDSVIRKSIQYGRLNEEEGVILDYGCGYKHLSRILNNPDANIIGYDIIPNLSDIEDFRSLSPSKIVCNHVLEHLTVGQIDALIRDFISMNSGAELIVSLPTENIISKIGARLSGKRHFHYEHRSSYKQVNEVIERYYDVKKREYIWLSMTQISLYQLK